MYTGNGVTKKFPLPDGKDGSVVFLIFPTGKSIKMEKEEGYTVSDGAVYFSVAIPAGVVVSFEEPEEISEDNRALRYVVIYRDGRITEVTEDPAEYLAQSQKVLSDAGRHYAEVKSYASQTITELMKLKSELADELEGLLYEYTQRGRELITENAEVLKGQIRMEQETALLEITRRAETVESGLQIMELLKKEAQAVSQTAAQETSAEILCKCEETLQAVKHVRQLKGDCEYYSEEAKSAAQKAGLEVQAAMNHKAEEELEMLRSLRLKLESDSENLNRRIDSAWEMLRSEANGR